MQARSFRFISVLTGILLAALLVGCNPDQAKPSSTAGPKATPASKGDEEIPLNTVVATVNGEPVKEKQVVAEAEPLLMNLGLRPGTPTWKSAFEERRGALLDTVITRTLILQYARDADITIPDQPNKVEAAMAEFRRKFASDELFQKFLYEQEMSEKDLRDRILWEMKSAELIRQKQEAEPYVVTPEEVTAYFEVHPEFFRDRLHLHVIVVYVDKNASEPERKEKEGLAAMAKKRLDTGADFATVAREFSNDPKAPETGGDLGFVSPDDLDKPILAAVQNAPLGAVVGPIESAEGYYIVKLDQRGQTLADGNLREDLRKELEEKKRAENFVRWLDTVKASKQRTTITIVHEHYRKFFTGNAELLGP